MKNLRLFAGVIMGSVLTALCMSPVLASAQSAGFSSEMGVGTTGNEVTSLQTWLENNDYYSGPITGYYGSLTMAAVESYQTAHNISPTGYVGPLTLAALNGQASGSVSTGGSTSELASLRAQLQALLAQIAQIGQTSQSSVPETSVTTTASAPMCATVTVPSCTGTLTAQQNSNGCVTGYQCTSAATAPSSSTNQTQSTAANISTSASGIVTEVLPSPDVSGSASGVTSESCVGGSPKYMSAGGFNLAGISDGQTNSDIYACIPTSTTCPAYQIICPDSTAGNSSGSAITYVHQGDMCQTPLPLSQSGCGVEYVYTNNQAYFPVADAGTWVTNNTQSGTGSTQATFPVTGILITTQGSGPMINNGNGSYYSITNWAFQTVAPEVPVASQ